MEFDAGKATRARISSWLNKKNKVSLPHMNIGESNFIPSILDLICEHKFKSSDGDLAEIAKSNK